MPTRPLALIVGAGDGLSAALARVLDQDGGMRVALASRRPERLREQALQLGGLALRCDATRPADVDALFSLLDDEHGGGPEVVVYNAAARLRGAITELDPAQVLQVLQVNAHGAMLVAQQAARRMLARGHGTLLFTGASASVKGFAGSSAFAMGKFALRGLAQALARELAPQGVHVAHVVIDGGIAHPDRAPAAQPDGQLDPESIARNYLHLIRQERSAWSWEIELRPWVERF
ncbi:SDR family NAD(P)-dependent oxidoreductase [Thiomonas sp. FB-6]|uniref:SDR family NAD(P)-dependent oxidoreductase n=1 Tax=Thiomonas sp. FB-6 TaxID=1158291 RepID=UPI000363884A|nr:SDR family NAD(P)-dependent oxidoreductase [Thiomonas sp. FB-6]